MNQKEAQAQGRMAGERLAAAGGLSLAMRMAQLAEAERLALLRALGAQGAERLLHDWRFWGRPGQLPPSGDWRVWLVLAGRGFGKTRAGAEWVRRVARHSGAWKVQEPAAAPLIPSRECHLRHFTGLLGGGFLGGGLARGGEAKAEEADGRTINGSRSGAGSGAGSCNEREERAATGTGGPVRIALVAATLAEARAVMVEGESGLLAIAPPDERPVFEPALRRLVWPNGSVAHLYSADAPEQLRGSQHHFAWCDEAAKWRNAETVWANLELGLRLGPRPRVLVTTTPRPVPLVRRLLADPAVQVTRGATWDNAANLPQSFLDAMTATYGGTRLGRQELEGEMVEAVEGALWSPELIERNRVDTAALLARVVVAVDPPVTGGPEADACGIIVAALGADGHGYVLADRTVEGASPSGWARAVAAAAADFEAERVVAEVNNGGDLVGLVLRSAGCSAPLRLVRASRGKAARAEPVAALYEQGRVHHTGGLPRLEDELCGLMPGGGYVGPGRSPDRADALVWAMTELMLGQATMPRVRMI